MSNKQKNASEKTCFGQKLFTKEVCFLKKSWVKFTNQQWKKRKYENFKKALLRKSRKPKEKTLLRSQMTYPPTPAKPPLQSKIRYMSLRVNRRNFGNFYTLYKQHESRSTKIRIKQPKLIF